MRHADAWDDALTPEYIPNQSCPAALEVIQLTPEEVEAAENAYRQSKLEELAGRRWQAETGGTMVGGVAINDQYGCRKRAENHVRIRDS